MSGSPLDIIRRWESLAGARKTFEATWQDIADDILGRHDFNTIRTPGERRDQRIYDITALVSADMLASALNGMLTNPATRWFELKAEDPGLDGQDDVRRWLETAEDVMYAAFNSTRGGHQQAMDEFYLQLISFGTGAMFIGDSPGRGVIFNARALGEIYLSEDVAGRVDAIYRKYSLTARQAVQEFRDRAPVKAREAVEKGRPEELFEFIHAIYPNDDPAFGKRDARGMEYVSCFVSLADKDEVGRGGFNELPFVVGRWRKDAGETYGRGPGWNAIADVKMLHAMSKTVIKAAQKIVDPPLMVADDGVILPVRTVPGGLNFGRMDATRQDFIRPLVTGGRVDIGLEMMEQRRQSVRLAFYSQQLEMLRDPRATAAQVYAIQDEMARVMGPVVGRLQSEVLGPMIDRVFNILMRRGEFDEPPEALSGQEIKVEYVSPMARAQKGSQAQAILRTYEPAMQLAAIDPSIMDNLDNDESLRLLAEANGAPMKILRGKDQRDAMREARAQAAAQQAEMAAAEQIAGAVGKASPALKMLMPQEQAA